MLACGAIGFARRPDQAAPPAARSASRPAGRCCCCSRSRSSVGVAAHHQKLRHDVFVPIAERVDPARLGLVRARLLRHRRRRERGEPDRRPRRARGGHVDHRALHADRDGGDDLHPLGARPGNRIETRLDAAFIGAAVIGAAIGFLWFNAFPAEVFMGDTGAMALGGAIARDGDLPQGRAAAAARRRHLRDRGALGDAAGDLVQVRGGDACS